MSRRAHRPDPKSRRQFKAMAGYRIPEADIALVLVIDAQTLRKHYRPCPALRIPRDGRHRCRSNRS